MRRLKEKGEYALMDSTAIFSISENISFMEKGEIMGEIPKKAKEVISDMNIDIDILHIKG
jgi:hypothetical protein